MTKYEQLTHDLDIANHEAIILTIGMDDGGTCNLDSVFLRLPRYNEEKTLAAIQAAGLHGYKTKWFGSVGYMLNPNVGGQGNLRSKGMEIMQKHLQNKGYDASGFYQMD